MWLLLDFSGRLLQRGPLGFKHNTLQLLKDGELLVGMVDLGVSLLFAKQKADLLEPLEFALDIAGVFFDKLGQAADMRLEIRILGVDHDDLTTNS